MYTVVICIIIGILIGLGSIGFWQTYNELWEYFIVSIFGAICGAIIGFIIAVMLPAKQNLVIEIAPIVSLQDNSSINGEFVLGSGQIDGEKTFTVYYKENGSIHLGELPARITNLVIDNKKPRLKAKAYRADKKAWINNFAIDMESDPEFTLYIPQGTIVNEFKLDAQ